MKTARDPLQRRFQTFGAALKEATKNPATGVTQGGSSAKDAGCKPAAKEADTQNQPK